MLSFRTKVSYGVGGICDNALYTLTSTYLLLFLTTVAGVNAAAAGTITAIGSIWEAVVGAVIGYGSDSIISRYGRRKPLMMAAAFPVALVTTLLFTAVDATPGVKALYYGVMIVLFWTFFSMEFVPYISWGADLTEDYNERTVLRSYAYVFNQVGMLIGMVLPSIIVDYVMNLGKSTEQSWQIVGAFCGLCAGLALILCTATIHNSDIPKEEVQRLKAERRAEKAAAENTLSVTERIGDMLREYFNILKLKPVLVLVGASMLYLIANTVFSSDRVFFMTYNLGMSQAEISLFMLIITVSGVAFVPFIAGLANRLGKKSVFMYGIGISGLIMVLLSFVKVGVPAFTEDYVLGMYESAGVPTVGMTPFVYCLLVCLAYSVANTCYWQLMSSMMYDICEVEELSSGESHSGAVISLQALSESLSIAIGLQALGIVLDASAFDETSQAVQGIAGLVSGCQPVTALNAVQSMFTWVPGAFMILVCLVMIKFPIDKKTFERIMEAVSKQRAGEDFDKDQFKNLF